MMNSEEWQEQQRRDREHFRQRREDRKSDREDDWTDERKKDWRRLAFGILSAAAIMAVILVPMKIIDRSNCEDACEANGHEPFWQVSLGCLCDDGDGLYNPKDER